MSYPFVTQSKSRKEIIKQSQQWSHYAIQRCNKKSPNNPTQHTGKQTETNKINVSKTGKHTHTIANNVHNEQTYYLRR